MFVEFVSQKSLHSAFTPDPLRNAEYGVLLGAPKRLPFVNELVVQLGKLCFAFPWKDKDAENAPCVIAFM